MLKAQDSVREGGEFDAMSDLTLVVNTGPPRAEVWEGTYVRFDFAGESKSGKTEVWTVFPKGDLTEYLGTVQWFAHWRKYAFYPNPETVYEEVCMGDISTFLRMLTRKHRIKLAGQESPQGSVATVPAPAPSKEVS